MSRTRIKHLIITALFCALGFAGAAQADAQGRKSKLDARLRILQKQGLAPAADGEEEFVRLFIRLRRGVDKSVLRRLSPRGDFRTQVGQIVTAAVPLEDLDVLAADTDILGLQGARLMTPNMNVVRSNDQVNGNIGGVLPHGPVSITSVSVSSVIIGFVDSGIDYSHGDFITAAGKSRIRFIWDQTTNSACVGAPSGYSYGDEWTQTDIEAKIADTGYCMTQEDGSGHGTLVAGIAAGDGSATNGLEPAGTYTGIAPTAEIIMVRTTYNDSDIIDAVAYIIAKASALGKKTVVNLSLGGQSGPHDGTDSFDSSIGGHAAGTPLIVSSGNEQDDNPHALINVLPSDTTTVGIDLANSPATASVEFWHPAGDKYTVMVSLDGVGGSTQTAFNSSIGPVSVGDYSVYIDNAIYINPNGQEDIYVKVDRSPSLTSPKLNIGLTRTANGSTGRVDGFAWWSTKAQMSFASHSDDTMSIATPATAPNVFAVGSYASKNSWVATIGSQSDVSVTPGSISGFSGRGPTRDGRVKPDFTAPGEYIGGPLSINSNPASSKKIQDGFHRVNQGTSFSAPVVAGLVALKYAVNPTASVSDIRAHFNAVAATDTAVGSVTPNNIWGYGKVRPPKVHVAPSNVVVTSLSSHSIVWGWSLAQYATTYAIYNSTDVKYVGNSSATSVTRTGLYPNTLYAVRIHGDSGVGGNGPVAVSPSTYTLSALAVPVGAPEVYTNSILVNFTPPASGSLVNFLLEASPNSDFSAGVIGANGMNLSASSITVAGLASSTAYHLRLGTLNSAGVTNYSFISPPAAPSVTGSPVPLAPSEAPFSNVSTSTLRLNWVLGANSSGLSYQASISTRADFIATATTLTVTSNLFVDHANLFLNTTYYFQVKSGAGPYWSTAAVTWALSPSTPAAVSTFSAVAATSLRSNWSSGGNPAQTWYEALLSTHSDFSSAVLSSVTKNIFADWGASPLLPVNTTHYSKVRALSHGGVPTDYLGPASTATLAQALSPPAPPYFTGLSSASVTGYYLTANNPAGSSFRAELSTASDFSVINSSRSGVIPLQSAVVSQEVSWSGLLSNQTYYFRVAVVNRNNIRTDTALFTTAVATATYAAAPVVSALSPSSNTESSLTVVWGANNNSTGTIYAAGLSSYSNFSGTVFSSQTRNAFAGYSDLWANTTYYLRVKAMSLAPPNPDSSLVDLGTAGVTLAQKPPAPPADSLISITYSSITLKWTALPTSPSSMTCSGYRLEVSSRSDFIGTVLHATVAASAARISVNGLKHSTTYFLRFGSLNWQEDPNYTSFGSTKTLVPLIASSSVVSGQPVSISISTLPFSQIKSIQVDVPADAFPAGTSIEINPNVELDLPFARSNQGRIAFLGAGVGVTISAGGVQPLYPVSITVAYDPALGIEAQRLVMARFDEVSGQWTLLPTKVDILRKVVVGSTDHFSFFTPVLVTPSSGIDEINIFPIPWEPGSDDPLFNSQHVSFTNLPPDAALRIYNVTGELIWHGRSALSGTWHWDGENSRGKKVGSGTYIAVIDWKGQKAVRRLVVIR